MTTLPNRALFTYKLAKALKTEGLHDQTFAVLFLSLDPYPRINGTLGPAMGDRLVRCVSKRIKELMVGNNAAGYWGSDKFVFLLEGPGDESQVVKQFFFLRTGVLPHL